MRKPVIAAWGLLTLSAQAHALAIPVSERSILSLLGLGALATVLAIRYLRR